VLAAVSEKSDDGELSLTPAANAGLDQLAAMGGPDLRGEQVRWLGDVVFAE